MVILWRILSCVSLWAGMVSLWAGMVSLWASTVLCCSMSRKRVTFRLIILIVLQYYSCYYFRGYTCLLKSKWTLGESIRSILFPSLLGWGMPKPLSLLFHTTVLPRRVVVSFYFKNPWKSVQGPMGFKLHTPLDKIRSYQEPPLLWSYLENWERGLHWGLHLCKKGVQNLKYSPKISAMSHGVQTSHA